MASSEDVIQKAVPGGIGKPLILALLALLASGTLFGRGSKEGSATKGSQPAADEGHGGLLEGLGGLVDKFRKGGLGNVVNSWGCLSPRRFALRGAHSQGHKAGRLAGRDANQIRTGHQSRGRQGA